MPLLERRGSSAVSGKWRGTYCQACSSVKGSSGPCILPGRGAHETERSSRDDWYRDRISIQLTLIEVKKFSNLDDTDRPCWIPVLAVRRDTRVRSLRHGWYAHARYVSIDAEEDQHQDQLESQACLLVSYRPLARPKRTRKINVQLNAIAATKTTITSYRLVPSRSSLL